jgi:hypothetical protein
VYIYIYVHIYIRWYLLSILHLTVAVRNAVDTLVRTGNPHLDGFRKSR